MRYEYKRLKTYPGDRTIDARAARLLSAGWKAIAVYSYVIQFERKAS